MAGTSFYIIQEDDQILVKVQNGDTIARGLALDQEFQELYTRVDKIELADQVTFDISELPRANADLVSKLVLFNNKVSAKGIELKIIATESMRPAFDFMLLDKIIEIDYL